MSDPRPTPSVDDLIRRALEVCDEARNLLRESQELRTASRRLTGARVARRGGLRLELDNLRQHQARA